MLALVSPAKKLDMSPPTVNDFTQPDFLAQSQRLIDVLKPKSQGEIKALMHLSDKLAELNYHRYQDYHTPFDLSNAKQAIFLFQGDTYVGLDAKTLSKDDIAWGQDHLRMLSGLYGLLRPLDLIQAYRLEMGTKLHTPKGENLYDFWGTHLAETAQNIVKNHANKTIISLASNEYIKAIPKKTLKVPFLTCHFKEIKEGVPKVIGIYAKRARGMMGRYMLQNRIETPEGLKDFAMDRYQFSPEHSTSTDYVFMRENQKK